jgi:outer membrane protein assembly factor BamB
MKRAGARHTLERMARDPDSGGAFVFDLVEDGANAEAPGTRPGAEGAGEPGSAGPHEPSPGGAGPGLRALAPVAAVLAVLVGTGFAVDGARDGARMERMRDAQGGVVDLSSPPAEAWAWDGAVGPREAPGEGWGSEVSVLGGLLAFRSDDDLVALDPATGDEAWRLRLGENPDCGPMGLAGREEAVTRELVCLTGSGATREVVVVGPDGAASAVRTLDAADTGRYGEPRPGPEGTVLRAGRVGAVPAAGVGDAECRDVGSCTGTVEAGRDLLLRAEDARTGAERWSVTVPFRPTSADQCTNWSATSWDGTPNMVDLDDMLDVEAFGARITGDLVRLYGCGVEAAVTSDGVLLGTGLEPGISDAESLRGGGYRVYTFDDTVGTTLYDADGGVVGRIDGYVLQPSARDGAGPDTLLAWERSARLRAYAPDGSPRWDVAGRSEIHRFLAQVSGTALVLTADGTVRGLDAATGEERYTWTPARSDGSFLADLYVSRAFTDGEFVLLILENGAGGGLVTLDAASGEVVWEQDAGDVMTADDTLPGLGYGLLAVDGNLLEVTSGGVRGLG